MLVEIVFLLEGTFVILLIGYLVRQLIVSVQTKPGFRFWFLWCGLVPLISISLAVYIALTPSPVPLDYKEGVDPDNGFIDFIALIFYGVAVPLGYLTVAMPIAAIIKWRRSRK